MFERLLAENPDFVGMKGESRKVDMIQTVTVLLSSLFPGSTKPY